MIADRLFRGIVFASILAFASFTQAAPYNLKKSKVEPADFTEMAKSLYFSANPSVGGEPFSLPEAGTCSVTPMSCNTTRSGSLGSGDCTLDSDGTYLDIWTFDGTAGQTVTVTMRSSSFDSYLALGNPDGSIAAEDNNSGGGQDARITFTLTSTGVWGIVANEYTFASGSYTVQLECSTGTTCTPQVRNTSCGASVTGAIDSTDCLESGTRFEFWQFAGTSGQKVTINASRTSGSGNIGIAIFDADAGTVIASEDPDNGTASVNGVLSKNGTFVIAVAATGTINYSMSIQCQAQSSCAASSSNLCLNGNRFRVTLSARDPRTGSTGVGQATAFNNEVGYYSVPALTGNPNNLEVFVKVLDGRPVNGKWWVFYGGLTDFELTIVVTDVTTGLSKTYTRPGESLNGGADVSAF